MAAGGRALALVGSACQVRDARYRALGAIAGNRTDDKGLRRDSSICPGTKVQLTPNDTNDCRSDRAACQSFSSKRDSRIK